MNSRRTRPALIALALGAALTGCSDDGADVRSSSSSSSGSGSGSSSTSGGAACPSPAADVQQVGVTLTDFAVEADPGSVKAGRTAFVVTNDGKENHELVVVRSASADTLPRVTSTDLAANTKVDEDKLPAGTFVGEVESFGPGEVCSGSFALTAGSYVLFCNIVEVEGGTKSVNHLDLGMKTTFTVS